MVYSLEGDAARVQTVLLFNLSDILPRIQLDTNEMDPCGVMPIRNLIAE